MISLLIILLVYSDLVTGSTQVAKHVSTATTKVVRQQKTKEPEISVAQLCEDMGKNSNMFQACYCVKGVGVVVYINCPNFKESITELADNIKRIQHAFSELPVDKAKYKWITYHVKQTRDKIILFDCREKMNIMKTEYMLNPDGVGEIPIRHSKICFKTIPKIPPGCLLQQTLNCLCIGSMDSNDPCKCINYATQNNKRTMFFRCKGTHHQPLVDSIKSFYQKVASIEGNSTAVRFYVPHPIQITSIKSCNHTRPQHFLSYGENYLGIDDVVPNTTLCLTVAKKVRASRSLINLAPEFGDGGRKGAPLSQFLRLGSNYNDATERSKRKTQKTDDQGSDKRHGLLDTSLFVLGIGTGVQGIIFGTLAIYKYKQKIRAN